MCAAGSVLDLWGPPKHGSQGTGDPKVLAVVHSQGCVSMLQCVGGCRAFLLFRWWLFLWLYWLVFPPVGQLLKQLSNAVLGGILVSKLIEEKTQVPCCFAASFLKITKARLSSLLKKQEENSFHPKNWVLREASNLNALQEAGTFR